MLENCKLVEDEIIVIPAGSTLLETETQVKLYIQPEEDYTVDASNFSISGYDEIVVSHVELNDTGTPGSIGNEIEVVITFNNEPNNPYNSVDFLQDIANWNEGNLPQQVLDAYDNYYGGDDETTEGNIFYIPVDIDGKAVFKSIYPDWQIAIIDEIEGVKNLTKPIVYQGYEIYPAPVKLERGGIDFKLKKVDDTDSFSFGEPGLEDKVALLSRGDDSWQSGKVYTVATYKLSFDKYEDNSLFNPYFYGYNTDKIKIRTLRVAGPNVKPPYNFFVEQKNIQTSRRTDSKGNVVEFIYAIDLDVKFNINVEDVVGTPFEDVWIEESQFSCILDVSVDRWKVGGEIDYISPADDFDNATFQIKKITTNLTEYADVNTRHVIPHKGISESEGKAKITIVGDKGATFRVTFNQSTVVQIEDYTAGDPYERSGGTTEFVELQGGGVDKIPEGEVTIPASGKYQFLLPDINPRNIDDSNNAWEVGYTTYDMVITCTGKTFMPSTIADTNFSKVEGEGKIGSVLLYSFQQYSPVYLELEATKPLAWSYSGGLQPSNLNKPGKKGNIANGIALSAVDENSKILDFEIRLYDSGTVFSVNTVYAKEVKRAASNNWFEIPKNEVSNVVQPAYNVIDIKDKNGKVIKEGNLDVVHVDSLIAKVGTTLDDSTATNSAYATLKGAVRFQKFGKQTQKYIIDLEKIFNNTSGS